MDEMNSVRAKFKCTEIVQRSHYEKENPVLYVAKFVPVMSGSKENEKFYHYSPSGSLELGTIKQMPFEIGKEYFLDISPAVVPVEEPQALPEIEGE